MSSSRLQVQRRVKGRERERVRALNAEEAPDAGADELI
jgi:hypothetical protein